VNEIASDSLLLSDSELLWECDVDTLRSSGPGGQHRNKTESGVRLKHRPTGVTAQAFERRSQARNREVALHRLRRAIAVQARRDVDPPTFVPSDSLRAILPGTRGRIRPGNDRFWTGARELLDLFAACNCGIADTAGVLGISSGALSRLLSADPQLLRTASGMREVRGLGRLK